MDLDYGEEHLRFAAELDAFLDEYWTAAPRRDDVSADDRKRAFRRLATERGYLYRTFPRRYGGGEQPSDPLKATIIRERFNRARAPMEVAGNGITMLAPTLLEAGADWQREQFIPPTLAGDYRWAQGYSEPGAGSDLASLRSKAVLDGDEWVIDGHKIWTSYAYDCTHMFILVRTEPDAPKHRGISYLLLPLDQPGVTIRRIEQISGQSEFCEVFLDGVRTPADWVVGERGRGWEISRTTLKHERNSIGGERTVQLLKSLRRLAERTKLDGRPAIQNPIIADRIMAVEGHVLAQVYSGYHQVTRAIHGQSAGIQPLLNKLAATQIGLEIAGIASDIIGDAAVSLPDEAGSRGPEQWLNQIFGSLALSIAGGTSNIQRNVIAERGLGLPREG